LVIAERGALALLGLDVGEPILRRLLDGDALARRGMDARRNVDPDAGVVGVGVFLALEELGAAVALGVAIIDEPSLARLALRGRPVMLADRHIALLPSAE